MNKIVIRTIRNTPVDSNCFLIIDPEIKSAVIIDPGSKDCSNLLSVIDYHKVDPEFIILTHEHFDHIWGVNALKQKYNCTIICSKECADKIINPKKNLSVFYDQVGFETYNADIQFDTLKFSVNWQGNNIELIKTKGHSEGSICIVFNNLLFTGDTVIKDTKTVLKLPDSDRSELKKSLDYLNSICNNSTHIYPGHGKSFNYEDSVFDKCL